MGALTRRLALLAGLALLACHGRATPEDCRDMKDHYIDLSLKETPNAAPMSSAQAAAVRDVELGLKRADPSFRAVDDHCAEVTRSEVRCALGADSTKAWEACVRPPDAH